MLLRQLALANWSNRLLIGGNGYLSGVVYGPVVYAYPWISNYFPSKNNKIHMRDAGPDPTLAEVLIQLFSDLRKIYRWYSV